jgi:putative addiction module component (TIGR02574 family)
VGWEERRLVEHRTTGYDLFVTDRARKVLADAMALSPEERATLATELLDSLPNDGLHPEWSAEIERRARRAWQDPDGGEPWDAAEERLRSRLPPS